MFGRESHLLPRTLPSREIKGVICRFPSTVCVIFIREKVKKTFDMLHINIWSALNVRKREKLRGRFVHFVFHAKFFP